MELTTKFRGDCLICHCRPTTDDAIPKPHPMIIAPGVDVNWGEDFQICIICAGVIADLLGRPSSRSVEILKRQYEQVKSQFEEVTEAYEKQGRRINRILEGKRAEKEVKVA